MFLAYCFISNVEIVTGENKSECKVLEAKSRAREMFKVLNGLSPSCLADLFLRKNEISGLLGLTAFSLTQDQTPKKRGFLQLC